MDLSEPISPSEDPPTPEIEEHQSQPTIVEVLQQRLAAILERLQALRSLPVSTELADELAAIQFDGARISRRLRVLSGQGLLTFSARSVQDPRELVRSAVREVMEDCEKRQISLEVKTPQQTPLYWLDPDQIVEALRCILDNAIEAVGRQGRIAAELRVTLSGIDMAIGNDGPTIAPDLLANMCAADSGSKSTPGIGLTIVRQVVDAAGGTVRFASNESWTEVVLSVPRARAAKAATDGVERPSRWVFPLPSAA